MRLSQILEQYGQHIYTCRYTADQLALAKAKGEYEEYISKTVINGLVSKGVEAITVTRQDVEGEYFTQFEAQAVIMSVKDFAEIVKQLDYYKHCVTGKGM